MPMKSPRLRTESTPGADSVAALWRRSRSNWRRRRSGGKRRRSNAGGGGGGGGGEGGGGGGAQLVLFSRCVAGPAMDSAGRAVPKLKVGGVSELFH